MIPPDFSTWLAVLSAEYRAHISIINRAHPYFGYSCAFERFKNGRVYIYVPFSSGRGYTTADLSEVRFDS